MKILTKNISVDVGKKLYQVRKEKDLTRSEMARNLGLARASYYKNELGFSLIGLDTMYRLHMDFDISIDWLLFDSQPMHNKEKHPAAVSGIKDQGLEKKQPTVTELLDAMEKDPMLLHEIMLYYYKYKKTFPGRNSYSD